MDIETFTEDFVWRLVNKHRWSLADAKSHAAGMNLQSLIDKGADPEDAADEEHDICEYEYFNW